LMFEDVVEPSAPILALLGDIGRVDSMEECQRVRQFLMQASCSFETVLYVPGNHEFWSECVPQMGGAEMIDRLRGICRSAGCNVRLCSGDDRAFCISGVKILATTLWTRIPKRYSREAWRWMRDFDRIRELNVCKGIEADPAGLDRAWSAYSRMFEEEVDWLTQQLDLQTDLPILVLTHHAPSKSQSSEPNFETKGPGVYGLHATDLQSLLNRNVKVWAFGHTHWNPKAWIEEGYNYRVAFVSNQVGDGASSGDSALQFSKSYTVKISKSGIELP